MGEQVTCKEFFNVGSIYPHESDFYKAAKESTDWVTASMFNMFPCLDVTLSNKVIVKDFGILCKEINENTIENDNTSNILKQLESLCVTCAVVYVQICYKFDRAIIPNMEVLEVNVSTRAECNRLFDVFIEKVFIEKRRQDMVWGPNQCHGYFWLGVLGEELGEFYEELEHIDKQVPDINKVDDAITELVQTAAVCFSWWKELRG